ncbi:hypothetical protein EDC01DRAFT_632565 [Geopyxis carbonaria]|nr:hypothetical protein EDC01DRAFT_632565 [Geopyxis carbonaria]
MSDKSLSAFDPLRASFPTASPTLSGTLDHRLSVLRSSPTLLHPPSFHLLAPVVEQEPYGEWVSLWLAPPIPQLPSLPILLRAPVLDRAASGWEWGHKEKMKQVDVPSSHWVGSPHPHPPMLLSLPPILLWALGGGLATTQINPTTVPSALAGLRPSSESEWTTSKIRETTTINHRKFLSSSPWLSGWLMIVNSKCRPYRKLQPDVNSEGQG